MFNATENLLRVVRAYRDAADRGPVGGLRRKMFRLRHRFWSMVTGTDIGLGARLGQGLGLPHANGVVIHEDTVIGDNCMIMQQVTIGIIEAHPPTIGSNVYIGAGAKVLGNIRLGDRARIGANAVVLHDVPEDHTAAGVPATIRPTRKR